MSMQTVLICAAAAEQVLPCPAGSAPAFTNAYLLDEVSASLLTNSSTLNPGEAADFGMLVFCSIILFSIVAYVINVALQTLRRI